MKKYPALPDVLVPLILLFFVCQLGCVALNVPSRRDHDPGDDGGVFGAWRHHNDASGYLRSGLDPVQGGSLGCRDCGTASCQGQCSDPSGCDVTEQPNLPEIPWPRFHPVPTRPVFGTPAAG